MKISLLKTYFYSVLFSVSLNVTTVAQADEVIEKSIQVPANGYVFSNNDRGDVDVTGWDKETILVRAELAHESHELILKNKGENFYQGKYEKREWFA